jgi:hypothetical protein
MIDRTLCVTLGLNRVKECRAEFKLELGWKVKDFLLAQG